MNDLDLLVFGVVVTFVAFAGAYVSIHHRASETTVDRSELQVNAGAAPNRQQGATSSTDGSTRTRPGTAPAEAPQAQS